VTGCPRLSHRDPSEEAVVAQPQASFPLAGVVEEGTTRGKNKRGARYTSGTEFYLATGDIYATQQLLGHSDVSTTANIYVQGSPADLEDKLREVWGD
jgi:integrase